MRVASDYQSTLSADPQQPRGALPSGCMPSLIPWCQANPTIYFTDAGQTQAHERAFLRQAVCRLRRCRLAKADAMVTMSVLTW